MSGRPRTDFTENLAAVAHGVRHLGEIRDPILREAIAAALRLRERELRLDPAGRARIRSTVLTALAPATPTVADRLYGLFAVLGKPAPLLVRGLVVAVVISGVAGGATVAGADALPDDLLYGFKLAGEQVRLAVAVSPEDRANVELSIAEHRLDEAERLASAGREDDAIIATAGYGSSVADAAADLASVEFTDPRTAGLVTQMQTTLAAGRLRVAATVTKLAADPRTAATAEVLAAVGTKATASKNSPATRIADQAAAITAKLAGVARDRADRGDARHTETPRATVVPRTDAPRQAATRAAFGPPTNPRAARQAAEKATEAAEKALESAAKAKRAASSTASSFIRR